ncbi:MAG: tryptophan--tRNA ligase [Patescibacteria group bacterium]
MSLVFSGIRPSGRLHLGNYLGAIKSWLDLQNKYKCIYGVVDLHAMTTPFSPQELRQNTKDLILDLLALGLDLKKSTLILQSQMPEHLELAWILGTLCPTSWLSRIPTYKEKIRLHPEYINLGILSYPVLMAADILIYKANFVPVGEDQLPHIELTNELARRFNKKFGKTFDEIKPIITQGARIMSLSNPSKKMSKTSDEGIGLFDPENEIRAKIKKATTDSGREIIYDPKNKPAISNLLMIYSLLSENGDSHRSVTVTDIKEIKGDSCRTCKATVTNIKEIEKKYKGKGYAKFKTDLAEVVVEFLKPYQEKREKLAKNWTKIEKSLQKSKKSAQKIANRNLKEIKGKIGLN